MSPLYRIVFSPEHIASEDLDAILVELRRLTARATRVDAEGEPHRILDLLAHAKTRLGVLTPGSRGVGASAGPSRCG
jgi:hypothetical protein